MLSEAEASLGPPSPLRGEGRGESETSALVDALHAAAAPPGAYTEEHDIDGATLTVGVVRAQYSFRKRAAMPCLTAIGASQ